MKLNKAISPILATVILIAVTLVIAIGVIGWIMGIWGTFGATETLQVFPDSSISGGTLSLHIKNTGTASAVIYKIEVVGLATPSTEVTVSPGQEITITATITGAVAGATYQVKIYTRSGNVYSATVQAK
jgi:flagellin-like protein